MSEKSFCAIFVLKLFFFFAEIDCLGVKQLENHGVHFFRALDPIFGLLMKTTPILCIFDTVNIYKVILPDRTIRLPCILQFRCRFKGILMFTKELEAFLTRDDH